MGTTTAFQHVANGHWPGQLFDCPACESQCHCRYGEAECVFGGEHRTPRITYGALAEELGYNSAAHMRDVLNHDVTVTRRHDEEVDEERETHIRWLHRHHRPRG